MDNVSLDEELNFHTLYMSGVYIYDENGGPRNYFQGGRFELYRGEMEPGQGGTGACYFEGFATGLVVDVAGFGETTISGTLTNDKLLAYKTYLSQVDISNPPTPEGFVVYKKDVDTIATLVEDLVDELDYAEMVVALPTVWKNNVLLQP